MDCVIRRIFARDIGIEMKNQQIVRKKKWVVTQTIATSHRQLAPFVHTPPTAAERTSIAVPREGDAFLRL
jgi:hypothetical protein